MKHRLLPHISTPKTHDFRPLAECSMPSDRRVCDDTFCPRHEPEAYASHMARHATDTLASA